MFADTLGLLLGIAVAVAFGIGGFMFGYGRARRASRWRDYEQVVKHGGAIVTVACDGAVCERATAVLKAAGAETIVDDVAA